MSSTLRKHATSIVLIALAVGVGGYVLVVDRGKPSSDELDARKDDVLPVFRRDQVTEIDLERDGTRVRLVRRGNPDAGTDMFWFESGKVDELADQIAVEQLMQAIEFGKRLRTEAAGFDRAQAGLDKPRLRMTVKMGATSYEVALGADAKTPRGAAFAELQGLGVIVASADFVRGLLVPLEAFRSHAVLPYTSSKLAAITLDGAGGHRRFVRGPWGGFRLDGNPPGPRVNQAVFDRLLSAFASINAEQFLDDASADAALAPPDARVTLTLEPKDTSDPPAVIELGGACPAGDAGAAGKSNLVVAIRRKPTRLSACVPASVLDDLRAPARAFEDRSLIDARQEDIEEIVLQQGDRVLDLARAGDGWHVRKPEDKNVTAAEASGLVDGLLGIDGEVAADVDKKAAGLDPAHGSLVVRTHGLGEEAQDEQKVLMGTPAANGDVVVLREDDGVMLRIPRAEARALEPSLTQLRSTTLVDVAATAVLDIDVAVDGKPWQSIARKDGGFSLTQPPGFEADGGLASDLFATLATLHAERWVADRDDGTFGLDKPRLDVRFETKEGSGTKSWHLLVGNELAGGAFARFDPDTGVFVLSRTVENILRGLVIDRSSLMVDASKTKSVELVAGDRKAVLQTQGDEWVSAADAGVPLAPETAGRIERALTELRAERVVHTGPARDNEGFDKPTLTVIIKGAVGSGVRGSETRLTFGRADAWQSMNVYYARREGIDATYVVAASQVQPVIDAMSGE